MVKQFQIEDKFQSQYDFFLAGQEYLNASQDLKSCNDRK